jgi:hypothetical protein
MAELTTACGAEDRVAVHSGEKAAAGIASFSGSTGALPTTPRFERARHPPGAGFKLRSVQADAGVSNAQNIPSETNAGFAVERLPAALRIL